MTLNFTILKEIVGQLSLFKGFRQSERDGGGNFTVLKKKMSFFQEGIRGHVTKFNYF